jgi:hypothetical protein
MWGKSMTGDRMSHITVTHRNGGVEITSIYAVNEDIAREFGQKHNASGRGLQAWLEAKGCRLDCSDRPADVRRFATGTLAETYYRDGKRHREDGPAVVWRFASGSTVEEYYLDDKRHREDGPAYVGRSADGTTEEYYRNGKRHRRGGTGGR